LNVRDYVRLQTGILLRRMAIQVTRTARTGDAEAIHDLRVAIRRLKRCLQVFAQFYPPRSWKPVRRRLAELMDACGNVRDRDIAIGLLQQAGVPATSPLLRQLDVERRAAVRELQLELRRWRVSRFSSQWRVQLEL
jgi:CHAD domain-containing protein